MGNCIHFQHFCPNKQCWFHNHPAGKKWYTKYSTYFSRKENKRCQRFMCLGCKKTFSERSFASDYYLKLDLEYKELFAALSKGMSEADWARSLGHSVKVIENRLKRLGRWLVTRGYVTVRQVLWLKGWGLGRLGLFLRRFWVKASCPEHGDIVRCFLKQLTGIDNVVAERVWTLLSWCYWLGDDYFYRPAFTFC